MYYAPTIFLALYLYNSNLIFLINGFWICFSFLCSIWQCSTLSLSHNLTRHIAFWIIRLSSLLGLMPFHVKVEGSTTSNNVFWTLHSTLYFCQVKITNRRLVYLYFWLVIGHTFRSNALCMLFRRWVHSHLLDPARYRLHSVILRLFYFNFSYRLSYLPKARSFVFFYSLSYFLWVYSTCVLGK